MKRSNFTFLFLFALLSFVSTQAYSQATCIAEVNASVIMVGNECAIDLTGVAINNGTDINGDPVTTTGLTVDGMAVSITGSGAISIGGLSGSLIGGESVIYEVEFSDGSSCWGEVNIEAKLLPDVPPGNRVDICCFDAPGSPGLVFPDFDLDDFLGTLACDEIAPTSTRVRNMEASLPAAGAGIACDTNVFVRIVEGFFPTEFGGEYREIARDSVVEIPIPFGDIDFPKDDEIFVSCQDIDLGDLDPNDRDDRLELSDRLSPSSLADLEDADENSIFDPLDLFPSYPKADLVEVDTAYYCVREAKVNTGTTELVEVLDAAGNIVHVEVPVFDTICVEIDRIATPSCEDFEAPDAEFDNTMVYPASAEVPIPDCIEGDEVVEIVHIPLPKGTTCNINAKCDDWVIEGECGLPAVMRTWTITNWCDAKTSVADSVQWIRVVDDTSPNIDVNPNVDEDQNSVNLSLPVDPWSCVGGISLAVDVDAGCGNLSFDWEIVAGNGSVSASGATATVTGTTGATVTVTVTNFCNGNSAVGTYNLTAEDNAPPTIVTEDEIKVSLGDGGASIIPSSAIDAGSFDACSGVSTCVLRVSELDNPVIIGRGDAVASEGFTSNGGFVFDPNGNQLYVADGCEHDGAVEITVPDGKAGEDTETIYFVICKDFVKVCCEDLAAPVDIALVGVDGAGNSNIGHTLAIVQDQAGVVVICGNDVVDCGDEGSLPQPEATSTCGPVTLFPGERQGGIDQCGEGALTVTWYFDEALTQFACRQTLLGAPDNDFDPLTIKWPRHQNGDVVPGVFRECVDEDGEVDADGVITEVAAGVAMGGVSECMGEPMGAPVFCDPVCTLIGVNFEDDFDNSDSETCRKIIRRWTVIDWCTFDANTGTDDDDDDVFQAVDDSWLPAPARADLAPGDDCEDCDKVSGEAGDIYFRYTSVDVDGYYTFDQVISIRDNTPPVISAPADTVIMIVDGNGVKEGEPGFDLSGCVGSGTLTASASDLCLDSAADGDITWWIVRTGVDPFSRSVTGPTATMGTGTGAPGETATITWMATDGCGNSATSVTEVTFEDGKAPTPVCIQFIATATMDESGESVIWASDFDFGSFDNCGGVTARFQDTAGNFVPSLTFTCADLPNGVSAPISLDLFILDENNNADFCTVTLSIQDNNANACTNVDVGAAISGSISTELGDMIESARVTLNSALVDVSSVEGQYAFRSNPEFTDYTITSERNDDYLNGVTTLDLVLIQQHVLGISPLDSPFKIIAADINSDTRVTAIDLVELRKLILGVYTELPQNDSWRFVDATQTFADATRPFPFSESLDIANLVGDVENQDFLGVKIGDVSGSAVANSLIAAGTRSAGTLELEIADATVTVGEEVSVAVTAANFSDIAAYQFTMDVSGLEFTGVESGAIEVNASNFGLLDGNTITTAWNSSAGVNANDVLFTMNFRATASGTLSDAIGVSSRVTRAAAYTSTAAEMGVRVSFSGVATSEFALFQNEPNPFDNVTRIGFELPSASSATLTVFDVTGKVVSVVRGDFAQGANTITLDRSDLNTSGVLYYQLESGEFTATKKMIVID